jgi:DNA-binding transcriptional MerR regulator
MEYTIEELAAAAGEKIDTIRFYQAKGLLPRPRRRGRGVVYGDQHASALRKIREYQGQGFPLALIKRLLDDAGSSKSAALLEAVAGESGARSLSRAELAAESGVPEAILASLEAAGLLVPTRHGRGDTDAERYSDADLQMAKAGLTLLSQGFPMDELLQLAVRHARAVEAVCDGAIDLFDAHVRKVAGETDATGGDAAAVADTFRTLLPAVTTLVAVHFQRTLLHRALERLRERRASDDLAAAVAAVAEADNGRLEVRWT